MSLKAITFTGSHKTSPVMCLDDAQLTLFTIESLWLALHGETAIEEDGAVLESGCERMRLRAGLIVLARVGIYHAGPGATVTLDQAERSPRKDELRLMAAGNFRLGRALSNKVLAGMRAMDAALRGEERRVLPCVEMAEAKDVKVDNDLTLDI